MRLKFAFALSLLTVAPAMAQEKAAAPALPEGWSMRLDRENVPAQPKFAAMGDGFHVTSGPAAIYYKTQPVTGDFRMTARASGTLGDPQGVADIHLRNGQAYGEPLDVVDGQVSFGGERVTVSSLRVTSNMATVDRTSQVLKTRLFLP